MRPRHIEHREGAFFADLVKIALGVFIGGLAAMFAYEGITFWRVEYALRQVAQQRQQTLKADRERAQHQQDALRAQQQQERAAVQAREAALDTARRLHKEQEQRRAAAWASFYRPSQTCRVDSATMACANEHMAARKRFDAQYVDR